MSGPEGWEFRHGWYWRVDNTAKRTMRAHFEDATGAGAPFDVTFDVNYGPETHPGFPGGLSQLRAELAEDLPAGGKVSISLLAALPGDRSERIQAFGSGSASLPLPLGQAGFEALNASFVPEGAVVEPGDLVLKSLTGGTTRQFSGRYNAQGLEGHAQVLYNAQPLGTLAQVDGQWRLRNTSGEHPLP